MGRVLLDCDGVLADFSGEVIERVNRHFDVEITHDDVKSFDMGAWLTAEQLAFAKGACSERGFARFLKPIKGAREAVDQLRGYGHDVFILTAPYDTNPTWESDRRAWLKKHMDIDEPSVISTTAKFGYNGDVFIDDRPKHLRAWLAEFNDPMKRAWLFTQTHNYKSGHDRVPGQEEHGWNPAMVGAIDRSIHAADVARRGVPW